MTPNTAMQTAVMWGYVSCSVAVYKYDVSVVEYCRYVPPDTPGSSGLFHHSVRDQNGAAATERANVVRRCLPCQSVTFNYYYGMGII